MPSTLASSTTRLKSGLEMPSPGFGTWHMGESRASADKERKALHHAFECRFRHFDTAEMYGDGGSEILIGEAFAGFNRSEYFLTSKFYPHHARADQMIEACERSLDRLQTDYLDLYLLHWPGGTPFDETLRGADRLLSQGKIRGFGVSNVDTSMMSRIIDYGLDSLIDVNQVMYNPCRRGIEFDLLPLMQMQNITCIAYTPLEPRALNRNQSFKELANEAGLTTTQLAFAWHLTRNIACPIPKSATPAHIDDLVAASQVTLNDHQLAVIDECFPAPTRSEPLDII